MEGSGDTPKSSKLRRIMEIFRKKPTVMPENLDEVDLLYKARQEAQDTKESTINEYKTAVMQSPRNYGNGSSPELTGIVPPTGNLVTTREKGPETPTNLTSITSGMNEQQAIITTNRVENAGPQPQSTSEASSTGNLITFSKNPTSGK